MARVTGIGGVFIRAHDPKALTEWYHQHLGLPVTAYGSSFKWSDEVPAGTGVTAWSAFPDTTDYFGKSSQQAVMINYRVDDLDTLLKNLEAAGVTIDPKRESYSYGHFAWITDLEGNRVELWQPLPK